MILVKLRLSSTVTPKMEKMKILDKFFAQQILQNGENRREGVKFFKFEDLPTIITIREHFFNYISTNKKL